jgi:hypothetical protein
MTASHCSCVTGVVPIQNPPESMTSCGGLSLPQRPFSPSGEPISNLPEQIQRRENTTFSTSNSANTPFSSSLKAQDHGGGSTGSKLAAESCIFLITKNGAPPVAFEPAIQRAYQHPEALSPLAAYGTRERRRPGQPRHPSAGELRPAESPGCGCDCRARSRCDSRSGSSSRSCSSFRHAPRGGRIRPSMQMIYVKTPFHSRTESTFLLASAVRRQETQGA